MPSRLCAFAPRSRGGWIMAFDDGIELWNSDLDRESRICDFEPANPDTRLNDGRTDRHGGFVVGGYNEVSEAADTSVVRVHPNGKVEQIMSDVVCTNSICFSPDGETMYFADTPQRMIRAYRYDRRRGLGEPSIHADLSSEPGLPDGSCVDAEGGVWNSEWQGGQVVRIGLGGRITHRISVPAPKVTCCAFGGRDLATLFITTSRLGSSEAELREAPNSGSLFAAKPGIPGLLDTPFGG